MSAAAPAAQNPRQRMMIRRRARRETSESADDPVPRDVWGAIARAALHQEGDDVRAWARLSLVNSAWRDSLQGVLSQSPDSVLKPLALHVGAERNIRRCAAEPSAVCMMVRCRVAMYWLRP